VIAGLLIDAFIALRYTFQRRNEDMAAQPQPDRTRITENPQSASGI